MEELSFEQEVLRIASNLWPEAFGGGSEIIDGRERDGVFITEDAVHLIECTISRTKDKAEKDVRKLSALARDMQKKYPDKAVKAWFITKDDPTPDQRSVVTSQGYLVTTCSYEKFQSKLVDAWSYFTCRNEYPFGSVRDPSTGEFKYQDDYVDIELFDIEYEEKSSTLDKITSELLNGRTFIIQGHYGVGKSMALKEVYRSLIKKYKSKEIVSFPVYINLRDHHGQVNPVEVIERHARNIGYKSPDHIVRAWRAGYVILILDGFDELAVFGWAGKTSTLKEIRYKSMELIREFIRYNPKRLGLLLSGRINYFDSLKECKQTLDIPLNCTLLKIGDFSSHQVKIYLKKRKLELSIPSWIPTRPLLLGYLVAKGILHTNNLTDGVSEPAEGWDLLLAEVCKREAAIEAGLPPQIIRELIEGIASVARTFQNGLGPLYQVDLERVFKEKCGYHPDDRALVLLQRLPGLAPQDEQDGSRYFIDQMLASTAKAGEIVQYISNPYEFQFSSDPRKWQEALDDVGIQVVSYNIRQIQPGLIEEAVLHAKRRDADVLSIDILMVLNCIGKAWTREPVVFRNIILPHFEIDRSVDWSRMNFEEVIVRVLTFEEMPDVSTSARFKNCIIGTLVGCSDINLVPPGVLDECAVDNYEVQHTTTVAILDLDLPLPTKVGLTILKKLYLQGGGGRQENAFYRGLTTREQSYVPRVLEYFKQLGLAIPSKRADSNKVWQPAKSYVGQVRNILHGKNYKDEIVAGLKLLTL